ncbi:leucine rich repeat containing protein [Alphaentomopoxvirus acuprea]|uniref:Leucine rich repeat containing protein n=1 Tax=Alphaentomopoxvirus acuprea TaxID=62099 RepID=W6JLP6_9POXV|nr:leucine rich repeat containing protein [Anomala cuprea entomopoxvirus]BAO49581.1 leucine rich repeat containing protein [Anomala cuprea entomopoxvirus]
MIIINTIICINFFIFCRDNYLANKNYIIHNNNYPTFKLLNNDTYYNNITSLQIIGNKNKLIDGYNTNYFNFGSLCGINSLNLKNITITNTLFKKFLGNVNDNNLCYKLCCNYDNCNWCNYGLNSIINYNYSHNNLINKFHLINMENAINIDLSYNKISSLYFYNLNTLENLFINNNNIFIIGERLVPYYIRIKNLYTQHNRINKITEYFLCNSNITNFYI